MPSVPNKPLRPRSGTRAEVLVGRFIGKFGIERRQRVNDYRARASYVVQTLSAPGQATLARVSAIVPPPLRPGSTVAIVAPASPAPRNELYAGLAWLGQRYRLVMHAGALSRTGYLAGDDARRAAELNWALTSPGIDAVACARGGYGVMRTLEHLDFAGFARAPRWLVGFSDITAFHVCAQSVELQTIHGPNVTGLFRASPSEKLHLLDALEGRRDRSAWSNLAVARPGRATGPLFGGNLALLESMASAGRLRVPRGAIMLLEDVTERPYRIDRMLTSLIMGGHLANAAAIVVGEFSQCDPGPDGVTARQVLEERLAFFDGPVVFDAPFGHGRRNEPFIVGEVATLEARAVDNATLSFRS